MRQSALLRESATPIHNNVYIKLLQISDKDPIFALQYCALLAQKRDPMRRQITYNCLSFTDLGLSCIGGGYFCGLILAQNYLREEVYP